MVELNRLIGEDRPQEVCAEEAAYVSQVEAIKHRLSNVQVCERDQRRLLAVLEPLQRQWEMLRAIEDAGNKANLGGNKTAVDSLVARSFNPRSDWDEQRRDGLLMLALWPELVGWRFKARNSIRAIFRLR